MKIAICIPDNHATFDKIFVYSLISVFTSFQVWSKNEYELCLIFGRNGRIDDMRNFLAEDAIEAGADAVMWMDSDMTFPPDTLIKLVGHLENDSSLEAASGLYTYKTPPFIPHIYPKLEDGKFRIAAGFHTDKLIHIEGAAFGCLLMKTSVFGRVEKPWFRLTMDKGRITIGEDLGFCREAKMNMLLDPTIRCGHLRTEPYGLEDYLDHNGIELEDGYARISKDKMHEALEKMP